MHDRGRAPRRYQPTVLGAREDGEGALDLAGVAHVDRGRNSTPNDGDTDWRAPHSPILRFMAGSQTTTTRSRFGAISLSSSSHFAPMP
jgi:hypothetical protein